MKKYLFVSDFDGTLTTRDFYWLMIDKYLPERGPALYRRWKQGEMTDIVFLGEIFRSIGRNEEEIAEDIRQIPLDPHAESLIRRVKASGGDFAIVSAGTRYYIDRLFTERGIEGVMIFSNEGYYEDLGIQLRIDPKHWAYSERYGIDKARVVQSLKGRYPTLFYAGDSGPDLEASLLADRIFAKDKLKDLLRQIPHPYTPIEDMGEVEHWLETEGWIQ